MLLPALAVAQPSFLNTSAERNAARDARTAADAQRAARSSSSSSNSNNSSSSRPSAPTYDPAAGDRLRNAQATSAARDLENRLEKSRQKQAELRAKAPNG